MALGTFVRRSFGRHERWVSETYRSIFINIDAFVDRLKIWAPGAKHILEVGCGEGAITERLVVTFPDASITGIDIVAHLGRLYNGPQDRARFVEITVQELAKAEPGLYDLIVLADVLHHVPLDMRAELMAAIRKLMAPHGRFVMKEWERNYSPIYWLGYLSDRWITGDRVRYLTHDEGRWEIDAAFGASARIDEVRIAPWRTNIATLVVV
jgi:2-polyprenyl-3-methyl-5-hydroxy-6-metoxy-1,4-benzoquinol methylase